MGYLSSTAGVREAGGNRRSFLKAERCVLLECSVSIHAEHVCGKDPHVDDLVMDCAAAQYISANLGPAGTCARGYLENDPPRVTCVVGEQIAGPREICGAVHPAAVVTLHGLGRSREPDPALSIPLMPAHR